MTSKYALRNFNKGLVESLELGQNRLVVSLENLKTKYKSQREINETIKELAKTPPRPKRKKKHPNTYHVNEGDPIWNGSVINNVNDISVKRAIIHDRKSSVSTKMEKGGCKNPRIITRKIKKCEENYPPTRMEEYQVPKIALQPTQKVTIESNLDINESDDSYEESIPEVNITKPSQRGTFKEIIQKSKKPKRELKNENVFEENLQDTYFKRLIDSGNTRSNLSKTSEKSSESQIKPESDFWNTRGKPLLGYDFIAGTLDNSKISVLSLPEKYFEKLQKFRSDNKNECYSDEKTTQKDDNLENKNSKMEPIFKNEETFSSPKCVHTRRLKDGKSLCNICEIVAKTKNKYPSFDSVKRNGSRRYPMLRDKIKYDQFEPKSMALKRNCSLKKIDGKVGCTLGHR